MKLPIHFLLILTLAACGQLHAEPREFTSADGSKTIRAELLSKNVGGIVIRLENGKTMTVQANVFSEADQKYIAEWKGRQPAAVDGWIPLFDGKSLDGWRANEHSGNNLFTVEEGAIKTQNGEGMLFYQGKSASDRTFEDFELRAKVKTMPNSNSGIFFHTEFSTERWPPKGFEAQVNATYRDPQKTGTLKSVPGAAIMRATHGDGEWFDYHIKVEGRRIVVTIDGEVISDVTLPEGFRPNNTRDFPDRRIDKGTFALQAHDADSVVYFKDLKVRRLP